MKVKKNNKNMPSSRVMILSGLRNLIGDKVASRKPYANIGDTNQTRAI